VRTPEYTLVFLHIPKTAGISLRKVLLEARAPYGSYRIIHPIDDCASLAKKSVEFRRSLGLVEGHLYFGVHEILPRPCVYMTMVRHPVERVLSYYSFVREAPEHHLHAAIAGAGLSLGQCIEGRLTIELDNFMVRCLTGLHRVWTPFGGVTREMLTEAKAHLDSIAAIGLTERFEESVARFASMFQWPAEIASAVPRLNRTRHRLGCDELGASERTAVEGCNQLDIELYEYTLKLWEARGR
jgi:hypothetical protein